jgi:hypothetical protein
MPLVLMTTPLVQRLRLFLEKMVNIQFPLQESIARWLKLLTQNLPDLWGPGGFFMSVF